MAFITTSSALKNRFLLCLKNRVYNLFHFLGHFGFVISIFGG